MAYEKQTWECGDVISAEKMNHMEDGIANAGGGDAGYECSEKPTEIINEEVTTTSTPHSYYMGTLSYSGLIDAPTISVSFDGQQYELPKVAFSGYNLYGGSEMGDFSNYPIQIQASDGASAVFYTPNEGTYSVKVTVNEVSVDSVTPCFSLAVKNVVSGIKHTEVFPIEFDRYGNEFYSHTPYNYVTQAFLDHKILVGLSRAANGNYQEGFLAGLDDEHGNVNFEFIFLGRLSDNSGLECATVTLKYDNTVTATIKEIAFKN